MPVSRFFSVIEAPGMTAPLVSRMAPRTTAVSNWACRVSAWTVISATQTPIRRLHAAVERLSCMVCSPGRSVRPTA
jgi:hypothetical protein